MFKFLCFIVLICACSARIIRKQNERVKYEDAMVENVLKHAPRDARLIDFRSTGPISTQKLMSSLPDNATLIREKMIGGFDCTGRQYGYYADTNNDCQVFHLCMNLNQIYPDTYPEGDFMDFSFICPEYTIFTQDAMVCAWERSAIPCDVAPQLYYLNNNFFVVPPEDVSKVPVDEDINEIALPTAPTKKYKP